MSVEGGGIGCVFIGKESKELTAFLKAVKGLTNKKLAGLSKDQSYEGNKWKKMPQGTSKVADAQKLASTRVGGQ